MAFEGLSHSFQGFWILVRGYFAGGALVSCRGLPQNHSVVSDHRFCHQLHLVVSIRTKIGKLKWKLFFTHTMKWDTNENYFNKMIGTLSNADPALLFGEQSRFMTIFYVILVRAIYLVFLQPKKQTSKFTKPKFIWFKSFSSAAAWIEILICCFHRQYGRYSMGK